MSLCFKCKYMLEHEYEDHTVTWKDACRANVSFRHNILRFLFGSNYLNIFTREYLYPCDLHGNCSYYKVHKVEDSEY